MKNNDDRLISLDVARGFDMLWITGLSKLVIVVCAAFGFGAETALAAQMLHPRWEGLHFIDFVFPTFIFIAGISFPYSLSKQRARGVPASRTILKIWKRAAVLVALGLVYNAILYKGPADTVWGSVLARIGLSWAAAATVAVLPEAEEVEVEINDKDIRIDIFHSGGAGGQNVNKVASAVRITHFPTGIVVQCQNERSQLQNKAMCFNMLRSKLLEKKIEQRQAEAQAMKGDVKKIEWGAQIRSYVFCPYTLAKDHRTGYEKGDIQSVMDGDIHGFVIDSLKKS